MTIEINTRASSAIARFRSEIGATQAAVAQKANLDQSRVSRIEKGEVIVPDEVERVLQALADLGAKGAAEYKEYARREWKHIEPPAFWNPQRSSLELTEETLEQVQEFLTDGDRPWPLQRQIERHSEALLRAATFLNRLNHNLAFVGDMGVGKSTAISFIFEILVPPALAEKQINRPVLETGAGGTTICEVHIKAGPEFGISLQPMSEAELRDLVSDFCAVKWAAIGTDSKASADNIGVSREVERAIRNMSGLGRKREMVEGKAVYHDPVADLARGCGNEEEFRTRILGLMALSDRTRRELWYDSGTRKHPMEWVTETFKAVNNGRMRDVSLPRSIDLLIPSFGRSFGDLQISVIDTKGVDDVAVREDLDARLKDQRTAVVFCSRFNDAPGTSAGALLKHMRQTFSERVDTGKVSLLALPRAEEARAMKDDSGEQALTDVEGYEFKRMQVTGELTADDLAGIPIMFFNVESDDAEAIRSELFQQVHRMRDAVEERLVDLCAAARDIIENHEAQALNAAIEEVASRLNKFLKGNRRLGARERLAYCEAIETIQDVRYASTLWAATRRSGEYTGLNITHLVGIGAVRDARARSDSWFKSLSAFLRALEADEDLAPASGSIKQISASASASKRAFLESAQRAGVEVYREALTQAPVWGGCESEWGQGAGFKDRVAGRLEKWFSDNPKLKEKLEDVVNSLWEQTVISPLRRLVEESAPEATIPDNLVQFPVRQST